MSPIEYKYYCPDCKESMDEIGSCGIVDYDGRWTVQSTRYHCKICESVIFIASDDLLGLEGLEDER